MGRRLKFGDLDDRTILSIAAYRGVFTTGPRWRDEPKHKRAQVLVNKGFLTAQKAKGAWGTTEFRITKAGKAEVGRIDKEAHQKRVDKAREAWKRDAFPFGT